MTVANKRKLGERMKGLRKENGLSQSDIAQHLGVTTACVANWENGIRLPDVEVWGELSEFYEVSVDYLCCRSTQRAYPRIHPSIYTEPMHLNLTLLKKADRERIRKYYEFLLKNY